MTCVVHYGVTRDWGWRGGLWDGLSPSATEGGPPPTPLWDCQRWGLLEESSCPKNTHTYSPKSQVKTPNIWLRLISGLISASLNLIPLHVTITQNAKLVSDLTDWQTIPRQMLWVQYWPPALHPRGSSVFPLGCYIKTRYVIYKEIFVNGGWTGWW